MKWSFLTLSEESKSVNSNKSSTAQEEAKLGTCCAGTSKGTCFVSWLDGSIWLLSFPWVQLEPKATRIPVARKRWWFAERLPATWIGSSQSLQNSALSSTQNMKAGLSYSYIKQKVRKIIHVHQIFHTHVSNQIIHNITI